MQQVISKCKLILLFIFVSFYSFSQQKMYFESDKRPIIEVVINGSRGSILVDTGSSVNIIDLTQMDDLRIKKRSQMLSANAVFGKNEMWQILDCDARIDGINVHQFAATDITVVVKSIEEETGIKIYGILGTPAIKELGMVIDLSRGIVTINKNSATTVSTD